MTCAVPPTSLEILRSAATNVVHSAAFNVFSFRSHSHSLAALTLQVVRTRLTADTAGRYTGVADAFRKVTPGFKTLCIICPALPLLQGAQLLRFRRSATQGPGLND